MQLSEKVQKYIVPIILIIIVATIALYLFFPRTTSQIDTSNIAIQNRAALAYASEVAEQNKTSIKLANPRGPFMLVAENDGQNAFDLLKKYTQVGYKEYDFGIFIESINGLANDKQNFWAFYVNGEFANRGISKTTLKVGDTIELNYEQTETYKNI